MKNWNNLSDDELDKLFKQSADEGNIDFEESAWQKMEQVLDEKLPQSSSKLWTKRILIFLTLLFVGSVGLYLGIQEDGSLGKTETSLNSTRDVSVLDKTKTNPSNGNEFKTSLDESAVLKQKKSSTDSKESEKQSVIKNKIIDNQLVTEKKNTTLHSEDIDRENQNIVTNIPKNTFTRKSRPQNSEKESNFVSETSAFAKELKVNNTIEANNKKEEFSENKYLKNIGPKNYQPNENNVPNENLTKLEPSDKSIPADDQLELNLEKSFLQKIVVQTIAFKPTTKYMKPNFHSKIEPLKLPYPELPNEEFFKKGWAVRLAISPDISKVGSNKVEKMGSNLGAYVEYRFSKRLSFQAGIVRSIKYYSAYPEQYDWIWGYPPVKLLEISAKCKMIDFPINLRYDFVTNTKSRIFGGIGLTTYKMMKETYDYNYEDNSNPNIKWHQWNGKTGTYYSSNLNLSIGFEKQISRDLTLQVEPFAKSPLKSIGFGKVPLITYGMLISTKYPLRNLIKKP